MEIQGLPVIYALCMKTVPCMFLVSACFCLRLPGSFLKHVNRSGYYAD